MTTMALRRGLVLAGVALLVTLVLLTITIAPAPTSAAVQATDTNTISRLQAIAAGDANGLQSTATVTETYAAVLAVGPLLEPMFSALFLPVLMQ